jgi:DtxR family Mn-dependent transcriptional regulator
MAGVSHGYHPPVEEYLEAVLELDEDGVEVIQARLAERLGHSAPTVSETVRRLKEEGYVTVDGRKVGLTEMGREKAESVIRKHRLAERLLVDVIGLPWEKSHDEATRWEHVISDEVEAKLTILLGNPATCPHGNPIPGVEIEGPPLRLLHAVEVGSDVVLRRVSEQAEWDGVSLPFLASHGLTPGAQVHLTSRNDDNSLQVETAGKAVDIDPVLATRLYVSNS